MRSKYLYHSQMNHVFVICTVLPYVIVSAYFEAQPHKHVNLQDEAGEFISRKNSTEHGRITSWGLTSDYEYWTKLRNKTGE
ncbi:hypothetical protein V5799_011253 [Amblyomma americanum]|uniref:Uncharacterized protein n=1 Tax=Amblyomma americanum TaxID=6943 RepID=A0AAQ4EHF0_AMBAM